jgi:peptidoglycan/LPS O-acetylase OafA/YrhL
LACCAALVGPLAHRHDLSTVFAWGTITSVMYVSLVIVLLNGDDPVTRFLSRRVFLRLATLGYAVYLVHPPIIAHVVAPAAAAMLWTFGLSTGVTWTLSLMLLLVIAALVAWALHVLVEKPALWLRDRLAP